MDKSPTDPLEQAAQLGMAGFELENLKALNEKLLSIKREGKSLDKERKKLSRSIGESKRQNEAVDELLAAMKTVSAQIKANQSSRKAIQQELDEILNRQNQTDKPVTPVEIPRYSQPGLQQCKVEVASSNDHAAISQFVENHPAGTLYHLPALASVVHQEFAHEYKILKALGDKQSIVGVLPIIRLKSRLFGDYAVSVPFFNYGGPIGVSAGVEEALIKAAGEQFPDCEHVELRETLPRAGMPQKTEKVSMVLELPDNSDALFQRLGSKLRAQIKRPQKAGVATRTGGDELLEDFYHVFSVNMRDLGTPVYGLNWFSGLLKAFPDNSAIVVAYYEKQPIAAGFLMGFGDTLEIPWASSLRKYNNLSANMLLYWQSLSYAIDKGYRRFDFGRSSKDSSTWRFKKQWGAQEKPNFWHYLLPEGQQLPQLNPNNPKFALMIAVWKRLPVWLTRLIGPAIVKNLP